MADVMDVRLGSVSASDIHRRYVRFSLEVPNSGESATGPEAVCQQRALISAIDLATAAAQKLTFAKVGHFGTFASKLTWQS